LGTGSPASCHPRVHPPFPTFDQKDPLFPFSEICLGTFPAGTYEFGAEGNAAGTLKAGLSLDELDAQIDVPGHTAKLGRIVPARAVLTAGPDGGRLSRLGYLSHGFSSYAIV
jgi:hypothetical protein